MGLSTAERNRRKRERKKREKQQRRLEEEEKTQAPAASEKGEDEAKEEEIEIEYVVEPVPMVGATAEPKASSVPDGLPPGMGGADVAPQQENMESVLRRFHQRAAVSAAVVSDDEKKASQNKPFAPPGSSDEEGEYDDDDEDGERKPMSKRKLRELLRPSVAELKRQVKRPDLVEAHDITATDPVFLIELKSIPGTVPVPRHWGRKRKYLQGKRGFEKPPFQLPDFIVKTGITDIRDTVAEDEAKQTAKQSNRARVNPKMGAMDVDYKTLYEAFFRYQTKPSDLTRFGDLYYEGRELETSTDRKPGGRFSKTLREALGMIADTAPPPWLINMQRYGPPPSYPHLSIPGLNAPLPNDQCQYGYHAGGWGKPPVDAYGRPLYGGNPFDPPGSGKKADELNATIVTSDGKPLGKASWGSLPTGFDEADEESDVEESSVEESSVDDMEESDAEEEEEAGDGIASVLPPPPTAAATAPGDLRKQTAGDETPMANSGPKQLYQVLQTKAAEQQGGVFQGQTKYVLPGNSDVPEGAESVLSKAIAPNETAKRKRKHDDDREDDLSKNFKF